MIKFLHLSDSHLGECMPLYRTPPKNWRGECFVKNYYKALEPALQEKVDFVLHSGDLFDKRHINMDIIGRAMVPLRIIAGKNIPIFIVPGNHEREHIPGGLLLAGDNIHIFSKPLKIEFTIREENVVIVGFPFIRYGARKVFKKILGQTGWKRKKGTTDILLCHQTFEGAKVGRKDFTFRNGENVVSISDIPQGFNYVACGHIHKPQILKTKEPTICYAGSTERVSFREMEEDKGYYVTTIEHGIIHPKFHKLSCTSMFRAKVSVTGHSGEEIAKLLEEKISNLKPHSVLRFHLEGEMELEVLKKIPLYLYKKKRDDVKIEFRKENLVILKDKKKRFYSQREDKSEEIRSMPYSIEIENFKKRFSFTEESIKNVPIQSGVYMLLNQDDRVFYIGKANNLKVRLISHLRNKKKSNGGFYFWLKQVMKVEIITTGDEFSALFLEMSLIRSELPPYNKQIKEYQNYVYLVVQKDISYPTIKIVDEVRNDGNPYFGPFKKEYKIRENIKFIKEVFGIRPCRRNLDDSLRLFSCPLEEMGKCDAPCRGGVSPSDYSRRIDDMIEFLSGKNIGVVKKLEREKNRLVGIRDFERAAELQGKITNLRIIFNSLKKIAETWEVKGTLVLNLGAGINWTYGVRNGRVLWSQDEENLTNVFPPRKWELDEMMLIASAKIRKDKCFSNES